MNLDRALDIPGFMSTAELKQLSRWASEHATIVEIGSFMGRSTRALADNTPGRVIAVDDFVGLRERNDNPAQDSIREAFRANLADHLATGKVVMNEADHAQSAPTDCDMCFIDGSHDYISVSRDIAKWRTVTKGLLCGHDFDVAHSDVMFAVDELLPGYRVIPNTTLWYVVV